MATRKPLSSSSFRQANEQLLKAAADSPAAASANASGQPDDGGPSCGGPCSGRRAAWPSCGGRSSCAGRRAAWPSCDVPWSSCGPACDERLSASSLPGDVPSCGVPWSSSGPACDERLSASSLPDDVPSCGVPWSSCGPASTSGCPLLRCRTTCRLAACRGLLPGRLATSGRPLLRWTTCFVFAACDARSSASSPLDDVLSSSGPAYDARSSASSQPDDERPSYGLRRAGGIFTPPARGHSPTLRTFYFIRRTTTQGVCNKSFLPPFVLVKQFLRQLVVEAGRKYEIVDCNSLVWCMNKRCCFEQRHRTLREKTVRNALRKRLSEPMTVCET